MDQPNTALQNFDQIERIGHVAMLYCKTFAVTFHLGRFCNYNCSYCWTHARSDVKDHRPTEVVIATIAEIKRQARDNGFTGFMITLSGGEPILHKGFLAIVGALSDDEPNCTWQKLHLTTNLSAGIPWWRQFVEAGRNLNAVSVTASWHASEGVDRTRHRQEFADKNVFLRDHVVCLTNIVMVPDLWDTLYDDAEYFNSRGMNVCLKPQSDKNCEYIVEGYTPEMIDAMKNNFIAHLPTLKRPRPRHQPVTITPDGRVAAVELGAQDGSVSYIDHCERLHVDGFKSFTGWQCNAGFQSIVIREPGGIVRRGFGCHDAPLGSIDGGFQLFADPIPCITDRCRNTFDLKIPKRIIR